MCCASGKVVLSPLPAPPEPLLSLLTGNSDDSKLFLRKIRKFNSCFQMTSFGATKICDRASDGRNFETTFKIQGQVYHKIGSLMPMPDNNPKFLQIYFMGDCEERVTTRCLYNFIEQAEERAIVILLEKILEDHNQLIQLIKRVSPRLQNDNYQIVIKADKVPLGEHAGRFNAPTVDEVAVIMVGDPVDKRSIKITRRDNTLSQRAILAAKNVDVDEINFQIQQLLLGDLMSFKSIDTVVDENESVNYPIEFLNSLDIPGMPPHNLRLKIGSPIFLLRNLNPPQLCNGTRLVIKKITGNILEATVLAGKFKGKVVLLPRIPMIPSDSTIPFKRLQFPIRLAFAMSINKSQGQTMSICGLDLENPCFSHGQLYVACSRVGKPSNLFVLAKDRLTKNIVHRLVLH
ncbi:unnamed protein product [Arctia plantaginis]|uniref:DNA helicase Pif1-like 2B domain-containing protein n=1 Tax=Arctia plantaginis TaxID=874455 RepID=A0A8S1BGC2_ARCPL|nr:unnamed protein product [Arctia plantaginis]